MRVKCLLLTALSLSPALCVNNDYSARKSFHDRLCAKRPMLKSCQKPFTETDYMKEQEQFAYLRNTNAQDKSVGKIDHKRAVWSSEEDEDYEYYMWRKYQREKYKRRYGIRPSSDETVRHVHYHQDSPSYQQNYNSYYRYPNHYYNSGYNSYPSYSYPSYGSYGYPSYGGYGGGYGAGYGGSLFNMGFGRQLGIMTPIGGFGLSSGFGIGIGK